MKDKWTTLNVPDLTNKTIIVTGGNSGLGYESVKAFSEKGANVILAARSVEKGEQAKASIGEVSGKIEVMQLDLNDFASIDAFAKSYKSKYKQIDVLMNNAGIMMTPYGKTKDGFEAQLGVNHIGHFRLTGLLLDLIISTPNSRVVNISSSAHKWGKMDFDNLQYENGGYTPMKAYGRSKISNLLFTYELQRMFEKNGIDSITVAAHPGGSKTNLDRHVKGRFIFKILMPFMGGMMMDQDQGALSQIRAAVDPNVKGGEYYGPHKNMKGWPVVVESNEASHSKEDARKLWEFSEEVTGIKFAF
jgi:NAD(P)-dependent dehydrogenase (short-subunit alcohol dehydrogenase family)